MKKLLYLLVINYALAWTHLELGAGNYGRNNKCDRIHTKVIETPVPKRLIPLPRAAIKNNPEYQYFVLFRTLDILVQRFGPKGTFYVNDFKGPDILYTKICLENYIRRWNEKPENEKIDVKVQILHGNFYKLAAQKTLPCSDQTFDSIHIKNPDVSFMRANFTNDGDDPQSIEKRHKTFTMMKQWANRSNSGLFLFIINLEGFIPQTALEEGLAFNIYEYSTEWPQFPYVFPNGQYHYSPKTCLLLHVKNDIMEAQDEVEP